MNVLIVDDEPLACVRMLQLLADVAGQVPHTVVGEAASAADCLRLLGQHAVDCILLDIQMPGQNGLELAQALQQQAAKFGQIPAVIFVTAYEQHAVQAFDLAVVDYLVKPLRAVRLEQALRRVPPREEVTADSAIVVSERGRIVKVPLREILFLKAELKYVTIRTREREFVSEQALTALESRYAEHFVRIHRNALVARTAITGLQRARQVSEDGDPEAHWEVVLRGTDERLEVSRRQLASVKALLKQ
jgi:two-component system, LytTR family, response regulator AlgR